VTAIYFTIYTTNYTQTYEVPLMLINPSTVVMDFYTATGFLVQNVPNRIYFQAWADSNRMAGFDFFNASIVMGSGNSANVIASNITTMRGRGFFEFIPMGNNLPNLVFVGADGNTYTIKVSLTLPVPSVNSNVYFRIMNPNRVLANSDDLQLMLVTNNLVTSDQTYFLQIKNKDQILTTTQIILTPNTARLYNISASTFNTVNGGILILDLYMASTGFTNLSAPVNDINAIS
jgi:hypothetical protein